MLWLAEIIDKLTFMLVAGCIMTLILVFLRNLFEYMETVTLSDPDRKRTPFRGKKIVIGCILILAIVVVTPSGQLIRTWYPIETVQLR